MKAFFATCGLAIASLLAPAPLMAMQILAPGDSIIAIDLDPPMSNSTYPPAENPSFAIDGTLAKYLNFGGPGSGLIVTPGIAGASIAKAIQLTTANDAEARDPSSYELWGTNDAITSIDNSTGLEENWTLISSGDLMLPSERLTVDNLISFPNTDPYTSYKFIFPTVKGGSLMQIAEVEIFGDVPSLSVMDSPLLSAGDATLAVQIGPDSRFPTAEGPANLLDDDSTTKYLNFGKSNSGFIVSPAAGASVATSFQITTANDFSERDPSSYEIYGTNDPIASPENSQADAESWTLLAAGEIALPTDRMTAGPIVQFNNSTAYTSYRVVFPTLVDSSGVFPADSMQISGFQLYAVPEPSSMLLGLVTSLAGVAMIRRRH